MADSTLKVVCVNVNPGICGLTCVITASKLDAKVVSLNISDTDCEQIKKLSERLPQVLMKELFVPIGRNPVFSLAEKVGCHPSCPVPAAVLKAAEVACGLALPRDVQIRFDPCES